MKLKSAPPKTGVKGFTLDVLPSKIALECAIADNGNCHPAKCWHKVAISKLMDEIAPGEKHNVLVDGGHIKANLNGWRYIADTPLHVKRSLMLFDRGLYDELRIRAYKLSFRRTTKIVKITAERQLQINAARIIRLAKNGGREKRTYNLRARVEGFSGIV